MRFLQAGAPRLIRGRGWIPCLEANFGMHMKSVLESFDSNIGAGGRIGLQSPNEAWLEALATVWVSLTAAMPKMRLRFR
jgi:hypothetical protein